MSFGSPEISCSQTSLYAISLANAQGNGKRRYAVEIPNSKGW
jgi:hypothetical protein